MASRANRPEKEPLILQIIDFVLLDRTIAALAEIDTRSHAELITVKSRGKCITALNSVISALPIASSTP